MSKIAGNAEPSQLKLELDPVSAVRQRHKQNLRWALFVPLMILFTLLNVFVGYVVLKLIANDATFAQGGTAYTQVVTSEVVISMVGGTVVQTGAALYSVARYLFSTDE